MPRAIANAASHAALYLAIAGIAAAIAAPAARANVGQAFGFGSRTAALAGAGVSGGYEGFAAYANPAGLAFEGDKRLIFSFSLIDMNPNFTPISNVIIENEYTSDKVTYGDVANDYRATFGQAIGITYRLFPDVHNLSFGIVTFLPIDQTAYMDTGETFVPEYFMYRSRTNRPQVELGTGLDLGHGLRAGVGFHLAFSLTSSATVFLQTDATKPSTMRFSSSLKPKAAPDFALLYSPSNASDAYSIGAVVRLPVSSPNNMFLKSGARAFGSFAALDFDFTALSTLYYDPLSLELGASGVVIHGTRTFVQLDYQAWSKFEAPLLFIQDPKNESCGGSPCGVNISGGKSPIFNYRDIVVPRLGQEIGIKDGVVLRFGYAYQPSILKDLPTGAGNYLDPSFHRFTLGVGLQYKHFLSFDAPCQVDAHLGLDHLVPQHIDKAPGDENGNGTGDQKIGAPGYDAGGNVYGGGVSLTLAF